MNQQCEEVTCHNAAQFIKRHQDQSPHWYCSTNCVDRDLERLESHTAFGRMGPYSPPVCGGASHQSSVEESSTEQKETKKKNENPEERGIGMTQTNIELESVKNDARELKNIEPKIMFVEQEKDSTNDRGHKSEHSTQSFELAKLESMNMLDDSIKSMHGLIISVRDNIKEKNSKAEYKHVDPAQVNAAANCAREMGNLMKIKVQLMGKK